MKKIFDFIRKNQKSILRTLLFLVSIAILVLIFPKEGKFKYEFQKGKPWMHEDLYAPFDFAIIKPAAELEQERQELLDGYHPYFYVDTLLTESSMDEYERLFERIWENRMGDSLQQMKEKHKQRGAEILRYVFHSGIIKLTPDIENKPANFEVNLLRDNVAEVKKLSDFYTIRSAYDYINRQLSEREDINVNLLRSVMEQLLAQNVFYDEVITQKEKELILNDLSITRGMVQSGERIISTGELVTNEKYQILESLRGEYQVQLGSSTSFTLIVIGQVVLIAISMIVLVFFLLFFRKDIYMDLKKILLVLLLIIFMVFITSLVVKLNVSFLYLVPICLIPIVIRAFFDTRLALYVHIITIIILGFLVPNSFEFVFSQLIAGIIAVFSVVNLQRRSQFFLTSMMIFLTYSFVYIGLTLIQEGSFDGINPIYFGLFAGSAILTLFSYPLIFILEKIFRLITDVTLMELSNTNSKLLRELSMKAPGTFQHSLQVANLADEVLYAIGGNSLLARTGALYHDIGKMEMPEYFIENQAHGFNPHDQLSFQESAEKIINHVTFGVEKGRKANLPKQIIDFIRTHHGTRKVEYFYLMHIKQNPDEEVDASKYTYPGPRPYSKETAVVMMADSVEAASRSLKEIDEKKINQLVDNIITKQVEEEQFIYTDLTMRDITRAKEILKKKLRNIYHARIEYPEERVDN
ncbi:MAG: HDIG domain-containing protein [Bacteroidota bacterium]|nr:HDIG domain-containing protein [Bacteroidota bacterium]